MWIIRPVCTLLQIRSVIFNIFHKKVIHKQFFVVAWVTLARYIYKQYHLFTELYVEWFLI